ncbi:MAG: SIMPL domain-containing protein [Thermoanaerobaculia bacterium]|nr:SIMPL domain-containing protein [Thermoanaerobaculia bacterium]
MKRFLIIAAMTITCAANALAQTQPVYETVSVTGNGRSTVKPDRVTFNAGVQTVAPTVEEAVNQNNARVAAVIAALKKNGATDADIRTSNFAIWPQQDYSQGKLPRILGYQVSNNVTVTRKEVSDAGKLLQVAVSAGVNQASGLQFEVSDPAKGRDEGLRAAFADARAKASLLAQAAGRSLGRAISISDSTQRNPPPQPMAMMRSAEMSAQVSDVPIESGSQENMYVVSAVFELR